jgi:pimeloyl-ACP methyl ester carboxylesterase
MTDATPPPETPPETPPDQPGAAVPPAGRSTRSAVAIGVLIGVLVFAVGLGAVFAVQAFNDDDSSGTSSDTTPLPGPTSLAPTPSGPLPSIDPRLASYYDQKLDWTKCGDDQCTELTVPLDYAKPSGRTIRLAVLKVPAADQQHKIGDLVVNPGGPGGSGVQYAQGAGSVFRKQLTDRFDIVGFDPRGVGHSDPIECVGTSQLDALIASDPDPDNQTERNRLDNLIRTMGEGCLRHDPELARHISTVEAARDIDILRGALRQPKLYYFGASYGTFLGATYANLFPDHVGRMVLDGAIDPSLSNEQLSLQQAHGFQVALDAYVHYCVQQGNCPLGGNDKAALQRVSTFLADVERNPLSTGTDRKLTAGLAVTGIWLPLYVKSAWDQLTLGFRQAIEDHNGSVLLALADIYASRGPKNYTDNSIEVLYAVNCLDHDDYIPTSQVPQHYAEFVRASPTFGKAFAYGLSTCSVWPVRTGNRTTALHAKGAPPILVVGTTRDPATPLAWAKALASELDSGVLLTRDGDGHTGYNQGNTCVDTTVEGYLTKGDVPPDGKAC